MPRTVPARLLLAMLAAAPLLRADVIRVAGTDLLGPEFARAADQWADQNGQRLALTLKGTHPGLQAVRSGGASVALLLLPAGAAPPGDPLTARLLGWHVTVVAVRTESPVSAMTLAGLHDLLVRETETGVPLLAQAPQSGPAWDCFRAAVLAGKSPVVSAEFLPDVGDLAGVLRRRETGLAVADASILTEPGLRPLALAGEGGGVARPPDPESLLTGRYPLRLDLWVALRRSDVPRLLPWLRFLTGDEAAQALARAGFMPLPAGERARLMFEFEEMR